MSAILYVPVGTTVNVIEGQPPVDQSAEVASLQEQVQTLTVERDQAIAALAPVTAERDALQAKLGIARVQAEESVLEAQQVKDALQ